MSLTHSSLSWMVVLIGTGMWQENKGFFIVKVFTVSWETVSGSLPTLLLSSPLFPERHTNRITGWTKQLCFCPGRLRKGVGLLDDGRVVSTRDRSWVFYPSRVFCLGPWDCRIFFSTERRKVKGTNFCASGVTRKEKGRWDNPLYVWKVSVSGRWIVFVDSRNRC